MKNGIDMLKLLCYIVCIGRYLFMSGNRLGELLIQNRLISEHQFSKALELQKSYPNQPIGQLLVQLGYIQEPILKEFLDYKGKRQKLGEILIHQKLLDEVKLSNALLVSKEENIPFGRALVKLHYIEEDQLARTIAHQYDLPYFTLDRFSFDPELSKIINFNYAQIHRIVPVSRHEKLLTLAMAFPLNHEDMRAVEVASGMKVNPVIATERDIVIAQQRIYRTQFDLACHVAEEQVECEISEDVQRDAVESKYVDQYYGPDTDYLVSRIISLGIKVRASDIHLESTEYGMLVRYRVDGVLQTLDLGKDGPVISTQAKPIISRIKIICDMDIAEKRRPQDSSFKMKVTKDGSVRRVDFRVSTVPAKYGENVVIRILDKRGLPSSLRNIGLSPLHQEALVRELERPTGIFLVTGPTGSGKSTTLYAVLSQLNAPGVKTLTVEDPIEYSIDGVCQSEVNEVVGNTFAVLLRSFLRQDPDNIMVGEIRDLETAAISARAALTGHTVLSTLHTNDATSAVVRLQDMGLEPTLISSTVRCVLSQRLVRTVCGKCAEKKEPADHLKREFLIPPGAQVPFVYGKGCSFCNYTGYSGRRPIVELWIPTREEAMHINKRPDNMTLREIVFNQGLRPTMIEDGIGRVKEGQTTLDELIRVVPYEQVAEFRSRVEKNIFRWDK
jgi:type II secretory ATPase GspE/PulE/Tfp pilus assembly ATPase PilB-like protein